ncbi:hypothetical protein [Albidovulum sp.]
MSLIRPAAAARLRRWRETGAALALIGLALWLVARPGWLLPGLGLLLLPLAAGWAVLAVRRLRFIRSIAAPGAVEIDEGQIGYLGPLFGGYVALAELEELRLLTLQGRPQWRLATRSGEVLLIPIDAAGAERLYDAFATLPGIDLAALARALDRAEAAPRAGQLLWRRRPPVLIGR